MFGKRKYNISGHDANGKYVEGEVWASTAKEALKTANSWNDGNTWTVARKSGCGCGG